MGTWRVALHDPGRLDSFSPALHHAHCMHQKITMHRLKANVTYASIFCMQPRPRKSCKVRSACRPGPFLFSVQHAKWSGADERRSLTWS
eukprot:1151414-Pelagomonas_calceolata.AAC.5